MKPSAIVALCLSLLVVFGAIGWVFWKQHQAMKAAQEFIESPMPAPAR